jgi:3-oxoacyl-[acyl-carrier protein] reductase
MGGISGKIAIVTGAGHGIGLAIVKALLREKVRVLATSRHLDALKDLEGKNLLLTPADLMDDSSFDRIVSDCVAAYGGIDIVINNAGYGKKVLLVDTSKEEWDRHMAINVRAPFMLVNAAMPYLLESDHATVINICSVVSHQGYPMQGAYSAAKHALLGYTKVLARETFDQGIRVHAISPGGVATEMIQKLRPDLDLSTLSTPEEIADIVLFLLKNRNGAVIDEVCVRRHTKEPWA